MESARAMPSTSRSTAAPSIPVSTCGITVPVVLSGATAEAARRNGVRTILTPAPAPPLPPELLAVTDLLVPNEHEAATLTGISGDPERAAAALLAHVPEVVITLGARGWRSVALVPLLTQGGAGEHPD